ncbi:hypothetical protein [Paenibacillus sp. Mc5Re-14]|uniref:hypothetical protein n=1 Tax=Paenibacillus sp. Mc5Re-14 TaxID=1030529 RepID=UPI000AFFE3B0|nr:hypothetical protein [Paenibacillus sp. Mc5Re-14]
MSKQMAKKEILNLYSLMIMISVSKNGESVIEATGFTEENMDKMMRVLVSSFDEDEVKANKYIVKEVNKLLKKLDDHEVSENQRKYFPKGDK